MVSLSLLYMLKLIHLIVTILSDRPSFEWECNVTGRPIWFSTCVLVVVAQQLHGHDAVWGFGERTVGGAQDVDWRRWLSNPDITFLRKLQGLVKNHSYFMQAVCTLLWTDCFETYSYIAPRPLLSWKKPGNFSFDNMGPLNSNIHIKTLSWMCVGTTWMYQNVL